MHYLVARDGQQLGQFTVEEIRSGLFDGKFLPNDLGWQEGQSDWTPLSQLFGQITPAARMKRPSGPQVPLAQSVAPNYHSPTNGLAVAALILGIICLFTAGLVGIGAVITIILGHMALAKVRQSHGQLAGKGMAVAGLVMGYLSLVLFAVAMLAALAVPTFSRIQERGNATKSISNVRQLITACRIYAADHEGKYPDNLEVLVKEEILEQQSLDSLLRCPLSKEYPGYDYYGAGKKEDEDPNTVIFLSKADLRGKRIVGLNDSSVSLKEPPAALSH
ncbi:MAG: DUF4190 domain-containing protein [Verrucomicrobium sp.]|nr:DUF4190 domain-containing protein [Verrucomicrobium sp.]